MKTMQISVTAFSKLSDFLAKMNKPLSFGKDFSISKLFTKGDVEMLELSIPEDSLLCDKNTYDQVTANIASQEKSQEGPKEKSMFDKPDNEFETKFIPYDELLTKILALSYSFAEIIKQVAPEIKTGLDKHGFFVDNKKRTVLYKILDMAEEILDSQKLEPLTVQDLQTDGFIGKYYNRLNTTNPHTPVNDDLKNYLHPNKNKKYSLKTEPNYKKAKQIAKLLLEGKTPVEIQKMLNMKSNRYVYTVKNRYII